MEKFYSKELMTLLYFDNVFYLKAYRKINVSDFIIVDEHESIKKCIGFDENGNINCDNGLCYQKDKCNPIIASSSLFSYRYKRKLSELFLLAYEKCLKLTINNSIPLDVSVKTCLDYFELDSNDCIKIKVNK